MYFPTCEKNDINLVRGSSKTLKVTILDANGNVYQEKSGDMARFGIKKSEKDTDYLYKQEVSVSNGVAEFNIIPENTNALDFGNYKYDIGLQTGSDYYVVIPYSTFRVIPNITKYE